MYWERCAERIWSYNPSMSMILILRDPVDRAYSHWAMETKRGMETLPFGKPSNTNMNEHVQLSSSGQRCTLTSIGVATQRRSNDSGGGLDTLVCWYSSKEELKVNPQETLDKICNFLSIEKMKISKYIYANQGEYKEPINQNTRQLLNTLKGEILTLEEMLDWDCSSWLEVDK